MNKEIDEIDMRILKCIQHNARFSLQEMSKRVHLSISAIAMRLAKLEALRVIINYTTTLNKDALGLKFASNIYVKLVSNTSAHLANFKEAVMELGEVINCYVISGEYDFMLKVLVRDLEEYNQFYKHSLASIANIDKLHSSVIVEEVKGSIGVNLAGFLKKVPKQRKGDN